jgi:hypothetical protein
MSETKIVFSVDRTEVNEGENVMVAWDCGIPDAVTLTIDNGYSTSQIQLADNGSRMVAIHKSKGRTTLRLAVATGGKIERREVILKVKNLKTIKTESTHKTSANYSYAKPRKSFSFKDFYDKIKYRLRSFCQRLSYGWKMMPRRTKRIYQFALLLMVVMWFNTCGQTKGYQMGYEQALNDMRKAATQYSPATMQQQSIDPAVKSISEPNSPEIEHINLPDTGGASGTFEAPK